MDQSNNSSSAITDRAFSRSILISVLGMLLCIICLCSTTWALFTTDLTSESNKVGSGRLGLTITVTDGSNEVLSLSAEAGEVVTSSLDAGEYTVTLDFTEYTTVTKGFSIISASGVSRQTAAINAKDGTLPFTFTLTVTEDGTAVSFAPHWGLPASPAIPYDGELIIPAVGGGG